MTQREITIDIEPDAESGLHLASMVVGKERYIIAAMPIVVQQMDSDTYEDFCAFCITVARSIGKIKGFTILSYRINLIEG